jgi:hypothetical protein
MKKIYLTRLRTCKLLISFMAAAIAFAPASPIWLPPCIERVTPYAQQHHNELVQSNEKYSRS